MARNAYLFTAVTTQSQVRPTMGRYGQTNTIQTWDSCASLIVLGDSPDEAQTQFEAWLRRPPEG
jgi:anaerobic selenocysteine-containing dehydrogenase